MVASVRAPALALALALAAGSSAVPAAPPPGDAAPAPVAASGPTASPTAAPHSDLGRLPAHFRVPPLAASLSLGADVLTAQERAFVATLPEIRVAIPMPAARPYEVVDGSGEVSGIHPDMLGYLARAFGLRVRPVLLPGWSAALQAMERREADLIMSIGFTVERARFLEFTLGVTPLPGAVFTRRGSNGTVALTESDLARARFALERDFLANSFVRRQYPGASVLTVDTTGDALAAVGDGRADVYLGSLLAAIDWLSRTPVPGIEVNRLLDYGGGHYHFAVRKDWAPLAGILNKGISSLRARGVGLPATGASGPREWQSAAASLPQGTPLPVPLRLAPRELDVLMQRPVWRVGAVRGLPLMNHLEPSGVHSGIAAEVTEQVVRRLGVGLQIVGFDTVGQMLDGLRRGEIDLIPFLTRTPDREQEFAFSQPYVEMPYVIVARSNAPLYWSLDSLRGRRLALAAQHPLRPLLASRYPDIVPVTVADGREALDAVADGRADAAVEVKLFANLRINGDGDDRLRTVATVDEVPAQFHFAGTQAGRGLLALVDRALADIPDAEQLRMRRRWVAVDLDPPFPWARWRPALVTGASALLALLVLTAWWVRRLSREVRARRRSEDRLRDIGATLPCAAFRHVFAPGDDTPRASWVSSGAQALLGLAPAPGQTILQALLPHLPDPADADIVQAERQCRQHGQRLHRSLRYQHPDGSTRWLSCEAVATPAEDGLVAWTGYVVDSSSERALQARLVDAAQSRNLVLASASHELRAPAHTLALALQALPAQGLTPTQDSALRIARDAVDTLSQLLGDVLDAARFDGAPLRLRPQDFDLPALLRTLADSAAVHARAKALDFASHVDASLPAQVHLDALRLRQVVMNLLSNAFKYTPAGRVELVAMRRDPTTPGGPPLLAVTVSDNGPGIAPALRERLFTPFATAPGAVTPGEGSSGLGLAISRQLAGLMGGRLDLVSAPGEGTRVTLVVPLVVPRGVPLVAPHQPAADASPAFLAGPAHEAAPATTRHGVLVVCDDDTTSRLLLAHLLRDRGYTVEEADRAELALQRCAQGGVAAVVTDLEMPGLGGLGLLQALRRQQAAGRDTPALVVCSGDPVDLPGARDTAHLADARLVKPVDLQALLQTLTRLGVPPPQP